MNEKIQMMISMAIFGTLAIFIRNIPLTSAEIALFRAIIALVCILVWQKARKKPIRLKGMGKDIPLLIVSGAAMGFNWIFLFEAYKYTTVSVATLSYYFAPVIVMLVCPIMFHEKMTAKQIICFVFSTIGLVLVIGLKDLFSAEGAAASSHLTGVAFGLAAATLYACVILTNKKMRKVSGIDRTVLQFAAAIAVLIPYILLTDGMHPIKMETKGWINLLIVGVFHTGITYCMYFSALKKLKGQEAAILSYIDPLVAVVISFTVLGEAVTPLQLLGGAMILTFTLANELQPLSQHK